MISLWTGSPPGEFTDTANATARDVLIYESLFATRSVLNIDLLYLQVLFNNTVNIYYWNYRA
jgi:hypothetical protein